MTIKKYCVFTFCCAAASSFITGLVGGITYWPISELYNWSYTFNEGLSQVIGMIFAAISCVTISVFSFGTLLFLAPYKTSLEYADGKKLFHRPWFYILCAVAAASDVASIFLSPSVFVGYVIYFVKLTLFLFVVLRVFRSDEVRFSRLVLNGRVLLWAVCVVAAVLALSFVNKRIGSSFSAISNLISMLPLTSIIAWLDYSKTTDGRRMNEFSDVAKDFFKKIFTIARKGI